MTKYKQTVIPNELEQFKFQVRDFTSVNIRDF